MSERLTLEIPGHAPVELPAQGKLVLGSGNRADVVVEGQGVDAVHCTIGRLKGGGWALKDLGSKYGTILNGKRTEGARLRAGDQILLGSVRLVITDPKAASAQVEPAPPKQAAIVEELDDTPTAPKPKSRSKRAKVAKPAPVREIKLPVIPGHMLERCIGRGGTGEVWLATQVSLDRQVALKMLSARLEADPVFVERFQAEARAAAALSHPNVVTVHDVGEASGQHYLSMEYMSGGCLEVRLGTRGPIPWREALKILLDASRGLEFAESRGVVHRDIKPANLMQTDEGITKICDLGLAVQVEQEELSSGGRKVFGTPQFIAPEVVRGERADPRSDLYSLGATAYRVIAGRSPFEGESANEILRKVLSGNAEPLHEASPGVPRGVSDMVMRLLEKDPAARTPSAAVLVRELERLLAEDGAAKSGQVASSARRSGGVPKGVVPIVVVVILAIVGKALLGGGGEEPAPTDDPGGGNQASGQGMGADPNGNGAGGPGDGGGPSGTDPKGTTPVGVDDDEAAKLLERDAEIALLKLNQSELTDDQRIVDLRGLAKRYLGTDAARRASERADTLAAAVASAATEEAQLAEKRLTIVMALRTAANLDAEPPRPGDSLRAIVAVPGQEAWEADADFALARLKLRDEVLSKAVTFARLRWAEVEALEAAGDFPSMVESCRQIIALVDLPVFPEDPPKVVELRTLADQARLRRDGAAELESTFLTERRRQDRASLVEGLGGTSGLHTEIEKFQLAAARDRLTSLRARLTTPAAQERVDDWVTEVEFAIDALELLSTTWTAGDWKRKSIMEPGGSNRDAVGVSREGVLVSTGSGTELLPWSRFSGHLRELNNLFSGRLERDWTADELKSIAALMRLHAIAMAATEARPLLDPAQESRFTTAEAAALMEAFDQAREWSNLAGDAGILVEETRATETLGESLVALSQKRWSDAIAGLERVLAEHEHALIVCLLSDGSAWRAAIPQPPEDDDSSKDVDNGTADGGEKLGDGRPPPPTPPPAGGDGDKMQRANGSQR